MKEIQVVEYIPTKKICEILKIQASTLRKYASLLDEKVKTEFYFTRDDANNRLYTKEDVAVLKRLIDLKNKPGYTLDTAVNEVAGLSYNSDTSNAIAVSELNDKHVNALHSFIAQQNKYFENYQEVLQKKDEQIDRLEALVSSMITSNSNDRASNMKPSTDYSQESVEGSNLDSPVKKKWWIFK